MKNTIVGILAVGVAGVVAFGILGRKGRIETASMSPPTRPDLRDRSAKQSDASADHLKSDASSNTRRATISIHSSEVSPATEANRPEVLTAIQKEQILSTTNSQAVVRFLAEAHEHAEKIAQWTKDGRLQPKPWNGKALANLNVDELAYSVVYFGANAAQVQQVDVSDKGKNRLFRLLLHEDGSVWRFEKPSSGEGVGTYPNGVLDYYYQKLDADRVYRVQFNPEGKLVAEMLQPVQMKFQESTTTTSKVKQTR